MTPEASPQPGATRHFVIAASLVVLAAGMKAAQTLLIPLVFSAFVSMVGIPVVSWLRRHRVPSVLAVLLVVLAIMAAVSATATLIAGSVGGFANLVASEGERFKDLNGAAIDWLRNHGIAVPKHTAELLNPAMMMNMVAKLLRGLMAALSNTLLVLLTVLFILLESASIKPKLQAALGFADDPDRMTRMVRDVQRYLVVKTVICAITGLLIAIWSTVMSVDFPWLWGLLALLLNYIPVLGSIMAGIPPVLLTFVRVGLGKAAGLAAGYLAVNVAVSASEPLLMGRRLGLSPLIVFLSLVTWGWLWGPVGMLLSVPMTMIIKILLENSEQLRWVSVLLDSRPR